MCTPRVAAAHHGTDKSKRYGDRRVASECRFSSGERTRTTGRNPPVLPGSNQTSEGKAPGLLGLAQKGRQPPSPGGKEGPPLSKSSAIWWGGTAVPEHRCKTGPQGPSLVGLKKPKSEWNWRERWSHDPTRLLALALVHSRAVGQGFRTAKNKTTPRLVQDSFLESVSSGSSAEPPTAWTRQEESSRPSSPAQHKASKPGFN